MRQFGSATIAALLLWVTPTLAQEPTWTTSVDILSKYYGTNGANAHNGPVAQTSTTVSFKNGLYFNLWTSKSMDRSSARDNGGNELDWMVGYNHSLGNGVSVDVSATYIDLSTPSVFEGSGDIAMFSAELYKSISHGAHTLTPFVRLDHVIVIDQAGPNGSWLHLGIRHQWQVNEKVAVVSRARMVYDTGIYGFEPGFNARLDTALAWKLSKQVTLRLPQVRFQIPITPFRDGRTNDAVVGFGVDYKF